MTAGGERRTVLSIIGVEPKKIGGLEAYARELSRQLDSRGWRSVLCFLSTPPAAVRDYLNLPNVVLESLERTTSGVTYQRRLASLIMCHRPAIVHLQLVSLFGPYAWISRLCGVKEVYFTDQASRPTGFIGAPHPLWKQLLFRGVMTPLNRVVCISHYVRDSFRSLGLLPDDRLTVLYNGVDLHRAEAGAAKAADFRKGLGLSADTFLVVQVGQIIPEKGVPDLLEAAVPVCRASRSVHFLFVGDGEHLARFRRMADSLGLADKVTFTGPVVDPLATGVFAAADMVCQVSRWEEAFGLAIAEAMAAAKPLLVTRVGGIPELVTDGVNGFAVPRGDTAAMAGRILRLAGDPALCSRLGRAGRKSCEEKFDLRKNVHQLLDLYGIA